MGEEVFWQVWQWLLSLSKAELVFLGLGLALLVSLSKTLRFLFLFGLVLCAVVLGLPRAVEYYRKAPFSEVFRPLFSRTLEKGSPSSREPNGR